MLGVNIFTAGLFVFVCVREGKGREDFREEGGTRETGGTREAGEGRGMEGVEGRVRERSERGGQDGGSRGEGEGEGRERVAEDRPEGVGGKYRGCEERGEKGLDGGSRGEEEEEGSA